MIRSRPVRFLVLLVAAWIAGRVLIRWPEGAGQVERTATFNGGDDGVRRVPPILPVTPRSTPLPPVTPLVTLPPTWPGTRPESVLWTRNIHTVPGASAHRRENPTPPAPVSTTVWSEPVTSPTAVPAPPLGILPPPMRRWHVDAWTIIRGSSPASPLAPQLGGSQAGFRASWRWREAGRTALFLRGAVPLGDGPTEVALGIQRRLDRSPITLFGEVRKLGGWAAAPGLGAFGGIDRGLFAGFRLEAYGQGGYVGGAFRTGYLDGQMRAARVVWRHDEFALELGGGGWGAVQRGAARLDVGPGAALRLPVGTGGARLQLDWRFRIAGDARPASGPALTLAAGF